MILETETEAMRWKIEELRVETSELSRAIHKHDLEIYELKSKLENEKTKLHTTTIRIETDKRSYLSEYSVHAHNEKLEESVVSEQIDLTE